MQDAALEVESNIMASSSLKNRSDKGKQKEEHRPSSSSQSKFHNLFMEERKGSNRHVNQYKRPNNPHRDN